MTDVVGMSKAAAQIALTSAAQWVVLLRPSTPPEVALEAVAACVIPSENVTSESILAVARRAIQRLEDGT